mmetsp:Transcript_2258/g.2903  ORF Transcript_2258/g.2903 Transcript_2258/m.2903 type:complete len:414 (-) Transcript_2258:67-1308(-)|eukprot:CAMPEP_0172488240 /NCGR_PEP_ID=MMETSP1066-20121228/17677_1 /TAXON_ID=671091 /ORGANISM="Coscinodiscus wailesii, Strain CCMP2513" /LENGTH=413 /DNA_ID=CAMNT_0013255339 /DNA_START=75 /DNA_END=1316 /DNA_ORIENTATION=-
MQISKTAIGLSTVLIFILTISVTLHHNQHSLIKDAEVSHTAVALPQPPRRNLAETPKKKRVIRIATLGGSVSWGANLKNQRKGYSWRLNIKPEYTVNNLAIRATGSDYPSHCAESMLGQHNVYDVILLEFTLNGTEGLTLLLQRLRKRFPEAILIYIDVYSLKHESIDPKTRLTPHQLGLDESINWQWSAFKYKHDEFFVYLQKQMKAVGGYMLQLPRKYPPLKSLYMFSDDWHHLSPEGHMAIVRGVDALIKKLPTPPEKPRLGGWGEGDQCESWFATGNTTLNYDNALLKEFAPFKYSMEFHSGKGVVVVHNKKPHKLPVFISYMARYSVYPITTVHINNRLHTVDPHITLPDHIMKTEEVGYADPGKNIIKITPQPGPTTQPFRLTGIIMCGVCHEFVEKKTQKKEEAEK